MSSHPRGLCGTCFNPARLHRLTNGALVCHACAINHVTFRPDEPDPTDTMHSRLAYVIEELGKGESA